jgi:diacylglycerol kinase family enzyme
MPTPRVAAAAALVLAFVSVALAVDTAIVNFPRGLIVLALVLVALVAACQGALRRGAARAVGLGIAVAALAIALMLLVDRDPVRTIIAVAAAVAALAAARAAFRTRVKLPLAAPPKRPVLIFNPRSGGGKATHFALAQEARRRRIEPIELSPGKDLAKLVEDALAGGADALAMAGGDGSQALVAAAAARAGIPYACIPAGTRNHFALDLGVDRDDVVGALDAFVRGGERRVDLAEVNGRVFVNNVSLGLYADAVHHTGYRDAKLRTLLDTVPEVAGPHAQTPPLRWREPDGRTHEGGLALLVSNNPYRLGRLVGSGTRPRLDTGDLGVAVMWPPKGVRAGLLRLWSLPAVEVDGDGGVPAGIDGEAAMLDPPLRFTVRPAALRVRIASRHPGSSPAAAFPPGGVAFLLALIDTALTGRPRRTETLTRSG